MSRTLPFSQRSVSLRSISVLLLITLSVNFASPAPKTVLENVETIKTATQSLLNTTCTSAKPAAHVVGANNDLKHTSLVPSVALCAGVLLAITAATAMSWLSWRSAPTELNLGQWVAHFIVYVITGKSKGFQAKTVTGSKLLNRETRLRSKIDSRKFIKGLLENPGAPICAKDTNADQTNKKLADSCVMPANYPVAVPFKTPFCVPCKCAKCGKLRQLGEACSSCKLTKTKTEGKVPENDMPTPFGGPCECAICGKLRQLGEACSSCKLTKTKTEGKVPENDMPNKDQDPIWNTYSRLEDEDSEVDSSCSWEYECSSEEVETDSEWDYEDGDEWSDDEDEVDAWAQQQFSEIMDWGSVPRANNPPGRYMEGVDVGKQPTHDLRLPSAAKSATRPGFFGQRALELPVERQLYGCRAVTSSLPDITSG